MKIVKAWTAVIVVFFAVALVLQGCTGDGGNGGGHPITGQFNYPGGIATDGKNLYVLDTYNHTIRKVEISTGEVMTLAGTAGVPGYSDGKGAEARFFAPSGITTDGNNL